MAKKPKKVLPWGVEEDSAGIRRYRVGGKFVPYEVWKKANIAHNKQQNSLRMKTKIEEAKAAAKAEADAEAARIADELSKAIKTQSKINDDYAVRLFLNDDVLWLYITMNDTVVVQILERI